MNETQHPGPLEFRFSDGLGRIARDTAALATLQESLRRLGVQMNLGLAVAQIQMRDATRNCEALRQLTSDRGPVTADELAKLAAPIWRKPCDPPQHGPQRKGRGGKIRRW